MTADHDKILYYGVPFVTLDETNRNALGIVVDKDKICEVVSTDERLSSLRGEMKAVDLFHTRYPCACVIPGFVMSHTHFSTYSILTESIRVSPMNLYFDDGYVPPKTSTDVLERLKQSITSSTSNVFSQGYDPVLQTGKVIDRFDLDAVSEDVPIYLMSASMHTIYVNTQVLIESGLVTRRVGSIELTDKVPKDAESDVLSGTLSEEHILLISNSIPKIQPDDLLKRMVVAANLMKSQGITTVGDATVQDTMFSFYRDFTQSYHNIRVVGFPVYNPKSPFLTPSHGSIVQLDYKSYFENDYLTIGPMKVIGDGSVQGYTAYLREPYASPPFFEVPNPNEWRGQYNYPGIELHVAFEEILRSGMNIAIHGNGDADIDLIFSALEKVNKAFPVCGKVRLEHSSLITMDQLLKAKELGVHTSFLGHHVYYYGDVFHDKILGDERSSRIHPINSAIQIGVGWDLHSDAPVSPPSPLFEMWVAISRETSSGRILGKEERITPLEALRGCTIQSASSLGMGSKIGSIECGKYADFVLLSHNPLEHPIQDIRVLKTYVGGDLASLVRNE